MPSSVLLLQLEKAEFVAEELPENKEDYEKSILFIKGVRQIILTIGGVFF